LSRRKLTTSIVAGVVAIAPATGWLRDRQPGFIVAAFAPLVGPIFLAGLGWTGTIITGTAAK
jgi:hypothetical protein